jgi:hypothetical protein
MNNLFRKASSFWVKYEEYEIVQADDDGIKYIRPAPTVKPIVYDPLKEPDDLVLDALNVGMTQIGSKKSKKSAQSALLEFVHKYGFLGFMTALPTTPQFINYEAVYLPTNHFIKAESLNTDDYLSYFFPFEKLDFNKKGKESKWDINNDRIMMALAMTFQNEPQAMSMSFMREYCENYDWLLTQFKDWAFTFISSYLYYEDYEMLDDTTRELYQKGMSAFGGIAPSYHIELLDKPTIVWDFHSLLLAIQMMFSFMLTDDKNTLRLCKHCDRIFNAKNPKAVFCSPKCKNQYNVYKSREKKKEQ